MDFRTARLTATAMATALALTACADDPDDAPATGDTEVDDVEADPQTDGAQDEEEQSQDPATDDQGVDEQSATEESEDLPQAQDAPELPDPNDLVEDGTFRGRGIVLPVPDGFTLDPAAYLQGLVAAVSDDGSHQIAGQAVDTDSLPESITIDEVIDGNSEQFGEPTLDEEIDIAGAEEARQVRYDTLPTQAEGQPDLTLLMVAADNGDGRLAIFNYVVPTEDYDQDEAASILAEVGFDPDSAPVQPEPAPAPAP